MSIGSLATLAARVNEKYPRHAIAVVSRGRWWRVTVTVYTVVSSTGGSASVTVEGKSTTAYGAFESAAERLSDAGCPV